MNYLKRLQADNAALIRRTALMRAELMALRSYVLTNRKFLGEDPDGSRRDWIATTDIARRVEEILSLVEGDADVSA
jgi:hypothetical protein